MLLEGTTKTKAAGQPDLHQQQGLSWGRRWLYPGACVTSWKPQVDSGHAGESIYLPWPKPGAPEKGPAPPPPLCLSFRLPPHFCLGWASASLPRSFIHNLLQKGGSFQASRMEVLAPGPPSLPAHRPLLRRPHPGLPFLYGRQSANSQRREVGQGPQPREERLFTASGGSWLQRSGGPASR